jgi:hypothetical protein
MAIVLPGDHRSNQVKIVWKKNLFPNHKIFASRIVYEDRPDFQGILDDYVSSFDTIDITDYAIVKDICDIYNKTVKIVQKLVSFIVG